MPVIYLLSVNPLCVSVTFYNRNEVTIERKVSYATLILVCILLVVAIVLFCLYPFMSKMTTFRIN